MLPIETEREGFIKYIPKEVAEKYAPDFGLVVAFKPSLDAEGQPTNPYDAELRVGMLVAVKPYTGNWYTHADFAWIPEGRTLKILGTVEPWWENIVAVVEL